MENRDKIIEILQVVRHTTTDIEKQADRILLLFSVSGRSEQLPCEHISYRAGHSPFVPCICNDCGEEL